MQLSGVDRFLWTAGFCAHLSLLFVLLFRRRVQKFPLFSSLIAANILRTVILYCIRIYGSKSGYFYTFWSLAVLDTGLQLAVVYEMYAHTFRPLGTWASDLRLGVLRMLALTVVVASVLTWLATPRATIWMQVVVIRGNFFSSVCLTELFVGMTALSVKSGLPWETHAACIAQGLGAYSAIDVVIEIGHSYFGVGTDAHVYATLSHLRMGAYLVCVCYWMVTLWREARKPKRMPDRLLVQLLELQSIVESDLREIRARE